MRIVRRVGMVMMLCVLFCGAAWAMDFARMSNQELADLRGAIQNAPETERTAFQKEWEKRLAAMSAEEKKQYAPPVEQPGDKDKLKKPVSPGRGYDNQGAGAVIFGGGTVPEPGMPGGGK